MNFADVQSGWDAGGHALRLGPVLALVFVLLSLAAASVRADVYGDVRSLQHQGQTAQALQQADSYMAQYPDDPQMRFVKAGILSELGRDADARALLEELTRQYPELAEPWNNLAVLLARGGQLDEAHAALQEALRIWPDYETALANLGDLQLRLAQRSFEHALRLNPDDAALAEKLHGLRQLEDREGGT